MFKNTLEFLNEVANGEVACLDQNNYLSKVTDNFKIDKLELLKADLESYIYVLESKYYSEIPREKILNKVYPFRDLKGDAALLEKMNKQKFDDYLKQGIIEYMPLFDHAKKESEEYYKEYFPNYLGDGMFVKLQKMYPFDLEDEFFMLSCLK